MKKNLIFLLPFLFLEFTLYPSPIKCSNSLIIDNKTADQFLALNKINEFFNTPSPPQTTTSHLDRKNNSQHINGTLMKTTTIDSHEIHRIAYNWQNKKIKPSPPPPLMGKQMGTVETVGIPALGYELDGKIKVFHLIAQPIEKYITDGKPADYDALIPEENKVEFGMKMKPIVKKIKCWGYNGTMPGPTIECFEGDRIRIILKNELPEPTSIHWHGVELPNAMDGATPETNRPVLPGETFTYEFTLYQSGTLMYHSGYNIMKQDHYGLHGMLVVHPKKYDHTIDRDIAIFLQQFTLHPGNEEPNLVSNEFNWFTFNGFSAPSIPKISVKQGERVRIRFANTIMDSHPMHLHGYIWQEVGTEGGPIPSSARRKGSTINVPSGTTRDVEFIAWNPGLWRLHCHKLHHVINAHAEVPMGVMPHGGMFTVLHVIPKDPKAPWRHWKEDKK